MSASIESVEAHLELSGELGSLVLATSVEQLLEMGNRLLQVERHGGDEVGGGKMEGRKVTKRDGGSRALEDTEEVIAMAPVYAE